MPHNPSHCSYHISHHPRRHNHGVPRHELFSSLVVCLTTFLAICDVSTIGNPVRGGHHQTCRHIKEEHRAIGGFVGFHCLDRHLHSLQLWLASTTKTTEEVLQQPIPFLQSVAILAPADTLKHHSCKGIVALPNIVHLTERPMRLRRAGSNMSQPLILIVIFQCASIAHSLVWQPRSRQHTAHADIHHTRSIGNPSSAIVHAPQMLTTLAGSDPSDFEATSRDIRHDAHAAKYMMSAVPQDPTRRRLMLQSMSVPLWSLTSTPALAGSQQQQQLQKSAPSTTSSSEGGEQISIPLQAAGNAYLICYRVDGSLFRAVLDTGSPFLMIPGSCGDATRRRSGCYRQQGRPSGLESTFERFDGFEGNVEWRAAAFSFEDAEGSMVGPPEFIFGVASDSLMSGPGGLFFGLIRDTDSWIRPSFLKQTKVAAFRVDLASPQKRLTLSTASLIHGNSIPMTNVLRRRYGDPVSHYTAVADGMEVNGYPLIPRDGRPVYVIFDTGVSGMVMSQELFEERYVAARQRREKNLWGKVVLSFRSSMGDSVEAYAAKPLTTTFNPKAAWKNLRGHVIVMGLDFLDGKVLTVDIDDKRLWLDAPTEDAWHSVT